MSTESSAEAGAKAGPIEAYHDKPTVNNAFKNALQAGAFGIFVSAIQNSLATHKHGAMGIFTRTGSSIGLFAAVGAAFGLTESFVGNIRHKDDAINGSAGACASGLVVGASLRSVPTMFGSCAGLAALVGTFNVAGRSLSSAYSEAAGEGHSGPQSWKEEQERRRSNFFKKKESVEEDA